MTPRDAVSIRQMLDHADEASRLAAGRDRADLDKDRLFQLATTRLLEIVGEAAARVSPGTRSLYPHVAWPQIVALRNRLIHGYDEVDCDIMWQIIEQDLPGLVRELQSIVPTLPS
jgi:uncharacterized protein with HEPN domain